MIVRVDVPSTSLLTVCTVVRQDDVRPHPSPRLIKSVRSSKWTAPLAPALGAIVARGSWGRPEKPRFGTKNPFPMSAELSFPVSSPAAARFVCAPLPPFTSSPALWKSRNRLTPPLSIRVGKGPARPAPRQTRVRYLGSGGLRDMQTDVLRTACARNHPVLVGLAACGATHFAETPARCRFRGCRSWSRKGTRTIPGGSQTQTDLAVLFLLAI